jgi:hypothetical protein
MEANMLGGDTVDAKTRKHEENERDFFASCSYDTSGSIGGEHDQAEIGRT